MRFMTRLFTHSDCGIPEKIGDTTRWASYTGKRLGWLERAFPLRAAVIPCGGIDDVHRDKVMTLKVSQAIIGPSFLHTPVDRIRCISTSAAA